ncbi:MAG: LON peptidase substrate-binding domain-containing protein [Bryobacteraceae bacterium]
MQAGWLPLFPLEIVLFPGAPLPLHIFEDRYKEMIGEAIRDGSEFGIVLTRDKGVLNVGCTATVDTVVKRYPDGRLDVLTTGRRRFEVILLNEERTFLRAQVQMFDDEDATPAPAETRQTAIDACLEMGALMEEGRRQESDWNNPQLSFQLAQDIPDVDFRQILLRSRSERERLGLLAQHVPSFVNRLRYTAQARKLAPTNGHVHSAHVE